MDARPAADSDHRRKPSPLTAAASRVLGNPLQLRVALTAAILGGWYFAVSAPMTTGIDETTARAVREKKRLGLAVEVERLRAQVARFQDRLPRDTDANEWLQYMIAGARQFPVRLATIDTQSVRAVGPYKAAVIAVDLEGSFQGIDDFIRWVESDRRLFRIDTIRIAPTREPGKLTAKLSLLGVMG